MNTTQRFWIRRRLIGAAIAAAIGVALLPLVAQAAGFDHSYLAWDTLLKKNVVVAGNGHSSKVNYAAFKTQRAVLGDYLKTLSAVTRTDYDGWSKPQRLAFLINAYNAFTVELILTHYPDLKSIKDLGSIFQSPWQKKFFTLLGTERSLDEVEHDTIRAPGAFDDPRIHFAVNCASVGCPMLQRDAYIANRLDAQLDDATRRFLSDSTRNRFQPQLGTLAISKLFDWYAKDFERGWHGIDSRKAFFASHAKALADTPAGQEAIRGGRYQLDFMDYDWALNAAG